MRDHFGYPVVLIERDDETICKSNGLTYENFTNSEIKHLMNLLINTLYYNRIAGMTDEYIEFCNQRDYNKALEKFHSEVSNQGKADPKKGYVYLAQNTKSENLKIGFSKNPKARIKQLNIVSDVKIQLIDKFKGEISDEKSLHKKFDDIRMNSEWFEYSEEIVNHFENKS